MFGMRKNKDKFLKYDDGKTRYELLYGKFIEGVAEVLTYGANKYSKNGVDGGDNWHKCRSQKRYFSSLIRHLWAYWYHREDLDPETGKNHLFHAGCCLMFLYGLKDMHGSIVDDRPEVVINGKIKTPVAKDSK